MWNVHVQDCAAGGGRRLQLSDSPRPEHGYGGVADAALEIQGRAWGGVYGKGDALDLALRRTTEAC
jgi:hypothetical protein|eukprot:COSAG02_NODE_1975_length_10211_cov_8.737737_5_plen_66_part_00